MQDKTIPIRGYRKESSQCLLGHLYSIIRSGRQPRRSLLQSMLRTFDDHKVRASLKSSIWKSLHNSCPYNLRGIVAVSGTCAYLCFCWSILVTSLRRMTFIPNIKADFCFWVLKWMGSIYFNKLCRSSSETLKWVVHHWLMLLISSYFRDESVKSIWLVIIMLSVVTRIWYHELKEHNSFSLWWLPQIVKTLVSKIVLLRGEVPSSSNHNI